MPEVTTFDLTLKRPQVYREDNTSDYLWVMHGDMFVACIFPQGGDKYHVCATRGGTLEDRELGYVTGIVDALRVIVTHLNKGDTTNVSPKTS